jgi:hypothetical protein
MIVTAGKEHEAEKVCPYKPHWHYIAPEWETPDRLLTMSCVVRVVYHDPHYGIMEGISVVVHEPRVKEPK